MDRLNGVLDQIKRALRELSGTQKLLIASLVVILAMTMFLVVRYTAQPALKPMLPGSPTEDQREAVLLKVYQGFKFDEMAEILGCPVSTVKSRLYTALDLLKTALAPQVLRGDV